MSSRGVLGVCALVAVGGGAWWLLARDPAPAAPPRPAPVTPPESGPALPTAPPPVTPGVPLSVATAPPPTRPMGPAPALPALPPEPVLRTGPPPTLGEQFTAEPRDERWAVGVEAELRQKVGRLADLYIDGLTCKSTLCKIEISGDASAISAVVEGGPRLPGVQLTLSTVAPGVDGRGRQAMTLAMYATYTRPTAPQPDDD